MENKKNQTLAEKLGRAPTVEVICDESRTGLKLFGVNLGTEYPFYDSRHRLPMGLKSFNFIRDVDNFNKTMLQVKMRMDFLEDLNGTGEHPVLKIEHGKNRTYVELFGLPISSAIHRVEFGAEEKEIPTLNLTLDLSELENEIEKHDTPFIWLKDPDVDDAT